MDFAHYSDRAMEIHRRFSETAAVRGGHPWNREEIMQGLVGDVGDLMKLVMAKSGVRSIPEADRKLAHELADCLWSVLVLAKLYDVDLEKEFFATMKEIEAKLAATQSPGNVG